MVRLAPRATDLQRTILSIFWRLPKHPPLAALFGRNLGVSRGEFRRGRKREQTRALRLCNSPSLLLVIMDCNSSLACLLCCVSTGRCLQAAIDANSFCACREHKNSTVTLRTLVRQLDASRLPVASLGFAPYSRADFSVVLEKYGSEVE